MRTQLRKCLVSKYTRRIKCYFHGWGSEVVEEGSYSTAIVEHLDGRVEVVTPEQITFSEWELEDAKSA